MGDGCYCYLGDHWWIVSICFLARGWYPLFEPWAFEAESLDFFRSLIFAIINLAEKIFISFRHCVSI